MAEILPRPDALNLVFAHAAYRLGDAFRARRSDIAFSEVRSSEALKALAPEAHVIVTSSLWLNELLDLSPKLVFVQSVSAGLDRFDLDAFRAHGVRLASAHGVNSPAVAEHAMALILALSRHLHLARDRQAKHIWRPFIGDPALRETEQSGRTLLVVGMGRIGARLAKLAKAFDMRVIGVKRDTRAGGEAADILVAPKRLLDVLPEADVVVLTCPLTPETEGLINARAFAAMKPGAHLVNVARGKVVVEEALIAALASGHLGAAAIDCTTVEPLPQDSPLWDFENVLVTPHSAGETQVYEKRLIDILIDNLERLWRGDRVLKNQAV